MLMKLSNKPHIIALFASLIFACNSVENKNELSTSIKSTDTLTARKDTVKNSMKGDTILRNIFSSVQLKEINKVTTRITFTYLSKSNTSFYSDHSKNDFFGLYFFVNRKELSRERPFTAKLIICGSKKSLELADTVNKLVELQVFTSEIELASFLKVGVTTDSVLRFLGKPIEQSEDILFYQENEIILTIKTKNNKVQSIIIGKYKISEYSFDEIQKFIVEKFH